MGSLLGTPHCSIPCLLAQASSLPQCHEHSLSFLAHLAHLTLQFYGEHGTSLDSTPFPLSSRHSSRVSAHRVLSLSGDGTHSFWGSWGEGLIHASSLTVPAPLPCTSMTPSPSSLSCSRIALQGD